MKKHFTSTRFSLVIALLLGQVAAFQLSAQSRNTDLRIHVRGVYETKISLLPLAGANAFKSIIEVEGVKSGETGQITVPAEYLPGEFVLRFDYKNKELSAPYPAEKHVFINNQDLELRVNPPFSNNADSTRYQEGERENAAFVAFSKENDKLKFQISILQSVLMNYEDTGSDFYGQGIKEYARQRQTYNQWLANTELKDKALFVSNLYHFNYVPEMSSLHGSGTDRIKDLISHYFEGMDFSDPLILKTAQLSKWMDGYVNLYGQLSTSTALRDSLLPAAAKTAIEKAKLGDPQVYGWMVDYFYTGFESNNIPAGMKALEPYITDPNCLTTKRLQINRRLQGMEKLVAGNSAPNISMTDIDHKPFELDTYKSNSNYILLLFWSAGCGHCAELVKELQPWYAQTAAQQKVELVGIGLDETEPDIKTWEQQIAKLKGWKHVHAAEGINSKVANDYFILSTPQMFLLDAKTKKIVALPENLAQLIGAIK